MREQEMPNEAAQERGEKTRAVSDALEHLGDEADPEALALYIHNAGGGIEVAVEEVAAIKSEILKRRVHPPVLEPLIANKA